VCLWRDLLTERSAPGVLLLSACYILSEIRALDASEVLPRLIGRPIGRSGVTVNNVALATVDTFGLEEAARTNPAMADRLQRQLKRYMIPRFCQPDDVAGLATFLASPLASWISGQTYPVNGGYSVSM